MQNVINISEIGGEDWNDFLEHIEASFLIKLEAEELRSIHNYGQFCDLILSKLSAWKAVEDCSSQQLFYELRTLLAEQLSLNPKEIHPKDSIAKLFPKASTHEAVKRVEAAYWQKYRFHLDLMTLPFWVQLPSLLLIFVSIFTLFISFYLGLLAFVLSLLFRYWASVKISVFRPITLADLVKELSDMDYWKQRRTLETYNPVEIEPFIRRAFERYLGIEAINLQRDTSFI